MVANKTYPLSPRMITLSRTFFRCAIFSEGDLPEVQWNLEKEQLLCKEECYKYHVTIHKKYNNNNKRCSRGSVQLHRICWLPIVSCQKCNTKKKNIRYNVYKQNLDIDSLPKRARVVWVVWMTGLCGDNSTVLRKFQITKENNWSRLGRGKS